MALRDDAAGLAALHPVLALAVLGLASHIGSRYIGGRGSTAPAWAGSPSAMRRRAGP